MTFDETNGSQVEQVDSHVIDREEPPSQAIKNLSIGEVKPQEKKPQGDDEDVVVQILPIVVEPPTTTNEQFQVGELPQAQSQSHDVPQDNGVNLDQQASEQQQDQVASEDVQQIQPVSQVPHPRVH